MSTSVDPMRTNAQNVQRSNLDSIKLEIADKQTKPLIKRVMDECREHKMIPVASLALSGGALYGYMRYTKKPGMTPVQNAVAVGLMSIAMTMAIGNHYDKKHHHH
ncbi:hypothetical protein HDE_05840 [Halotydeus destructor]|nr:hypothetical protein HDE_05840 [Halotydeus destructor]